MCMCVCVCDMEEGRRYLEVDVNGEEVFVVDKRVISAYSGKISKLLGNSRDGTGNLKVIFHGFPGGAENFELITRFCYNKGEANIDASKMFHLFSAAHFLDMKESFQGTENLCEKIEKSLGEIKCWRWSEILIALKKFQNQCLQGFNLLILDKFLNSLISRIASSCETSPSPSSSSNSSGFILLCDSRSFKNNSFRGMWWFEDVVGLDARVVRMMVELMVSRNFDSGVMSKFLFYYQKSRFESASYDEKVQIIEEVVEMLGFLDVNYVSCKCLFELLRIALKLRVSKSCREKLGSSIGSLLDQATLDDLLIPSSQSKCYLYNVNLVLSFLRSFLGKGVDSVALSKVKHVASLIDLYLAEIAPDPGLKPWKFLAVIRALPHSARDSFNGVYHALNLYLEVHPRLSEEERRKLCCSLNFEKLSLEELRHLTQNGNFPLKYTIPVVVSQGSKLKSLLRHVELPILPIHEGRRVEGCKDQVVLYARQLNTSREKEDEVCMTKMQPQIGKMGKSRMLRHSYGRSLPLLCS